MLIGSSGRFVTHLAPSDCGARLGTQPQLFSPRNHADESGFELAKRGRTIIRMVGTFRPAGSGSGIDYRIEFIPRALIEVGIAFVVSIPILAVLVASRYVALSEASSLFVIVPLVVSANIWMSERQAQWLKAFVVRELEAGPSV